MAGLMPFTPLLGRTATLRIDRLLARGAYLTAEAAGALDPPSVLLPIREVPEGAKAGDSLEVFVYRDSDDRFIATRLEPKVQLGEVAFLEVTSLVPFGAFVDWGLPKELLVLHAEQTRDLEVGQRHPIGLYVDDTGRLAGTMRISEMLGHVGAFELDEWVQGEAWRSEPGLGVFIIVERAFLGLLPESEPNTLSRGDAVSCRIANILADRKIELSLRRHAHEEVEDDGKKILALLSSPGAPRVGDRSPPAQILSLFGLSKKAFKRATGRLFAKGEIAHDARGAWIPKR